MREYFPTCIRYAIKLMKFIACKQLNDGIGDKKASHNQGNVPAHYHASSGLGLYGRKYI